jgi:hypothetical protein
LRRLRIFAAVTAAALLRALHLKSLTFNIVAGVAGFLSISSLQISNCPLGLDSLCPTVPVMIKQKS